LFPSIIFVVIEKKRKRKKKGTWGGEGKRVTVVIFISPTVGRMKGGKKGKKVAKGKKKKEKCGLESAVAFLLDILPELWEREKKGIGGEKKGEGGEGGRSPENVGPL